MGCVAGQATGVLPVPPAPPLPVAPSTTTLPPHAVVAPAAATTIAIQIRFIAAAIAWSQSRRIADDEA